MNEMYGWRTFAETSTYTGKVCEFILAYTAPESGIILYSFDFSVSVKLTKGVGQLLTAINGAKLYKDLCDCQIVIDYPITVDLYSDSDCTVPLTGNQIYYGSPLCMKLTSSSDIASSYLFQPTSVIMKYMSDDGENITAEIISLADIKAGVGYCNIVVDVLVTGDSLVFINTVVLQPNNGAGRLLQDGSTGLQASTRGLTVIKPTNSGAIARASLITLAVVIATALLV